MKVRPLLPQPTSSQRYFDPSPQKLTDEVQEEIEMKPAGATNPATIERHWYAGIDEIVAIVRGFQSCTLARSEWTHRAHLTVALWYLLHHSPAEATRLVREGIKRFNAAHGIVTTATGGYHETLTLFWIRAVNDQLEEIAHGKFSLVAVFNELLVQCDDKSLPLEYYSRERLWSV